MHCATEEELCSWPIHFKWRGLFSECWLVDPDGGEWDVTAVAAPKVSFLRRLRHLSRQDQNRIVEVKYKRIGTLSLESLKDRTLLQIDRDPGDVMMQFEDEEPLRSGVRQAGTVRELIDYLGESLSGK
jgi:hypothetical protein